jgi:outer membrane protein assembly factor BamE (lipoprotein component of BamABCDE complex)
MKTSKIFLMLATLAGAVWLAGCSTPDYRIKEHPEIFAQLDPQEQAMVRAGQVGLGFSMDAVKLALGNPDRVTIRTTNQGQDQIWHYVETVYYDGAFVYGGPYWRGWGGRRWGGWGWGGGWGGGWGWGGPWGPYPVGPVHTYDRFRVEFRNNKVIEFNQEMPQ